MQIFGIHINKLSYKSFFNDIIKLDKQTIVFTPNPEILLNSLKDKEYENMLNKADFLTPDGIGLYIAFQILDNKYNKIVNLCLLPYFFFNLFFRRKYLYQKYGDRICGSDMTSDLIESAIKNDIRVTIIDLYNPGDKAKVASQEIFQNLLQQKFPKLKFDYFIYNEERKQEIITEIGKSKSKILFSTLGMKKQEKSIIEIMGECKNIKLGLGIGSSFDYFIGFQNRAPKIFRSLGIEWLYRIFTGPQKIKRLKRIYNAIFVFVWKVLISKNSTPGLN